MARSKPQRVDNVGLEIRDCLLIRVDNEGKNSGFKGGRGSRTG